MLLRSPDFGKFLNVFDENNSNQAAKPKSVKNKFRRKHIKFDLDKVKGEHKVTELSEDLKSEIDERYNNTEM